MNISGHIWTLAHSIARLSIIDRSLVCYSHERDGDPGSNRTTAADGPCGRQRYHVLGMLCAVVEEDLEGAEVH